MYGPGQPQPRPVPPPGGGPAYGNGPGYPQHGAGPYAPPGPQPPQQGGPYAAQPATRAKRSRSSGDSRLPVVAVVLVLVATGLTNAVWAPFSYLHDGFVGVTLIAGTTLFLAVTQFGCGLAWTVFGLLILTRRPFAWGGALTSAGVFAVLEGFDVARGATTHFVGLFAVVVVCALLNVDAVRRFCRVGPPSR